MYSLKRKRHLEYLAIGERIILKLGVKKLILRSWTVLMWHRIGVGVGLL
jgi:hypothetical protein